MSFVCSVYFTALMLTNCCVLCFMASQSSRLFAKCLLFNFEQILAVSNQNRYTLNIHIGKLDDTILVEIVSALRELCY